MKCVSGAYDTKLPSKKGHLAVRPKTFTFAIAKYQVRLKFASGTGKIFEGKD